MSKKQQPKEAAPKWFAIYLACASVFIGSLLAAVVIVGLVTNRLDPTGVALALCTLFGGTTGGFVLRRLEGNKDDNE